MGMSLGLLILSSVPEGVGRMKEALRRTSGINVFSSPAGAAPKRLDPAYFRIAY